MATAATSAKAPEPRARRLTKSGSLLHFSASSMIIRDPYGFIVEGKHNAIYQQFMSKFNARQKTQLALAEKLMASTLALNQSGEIAPVDQTQLDTFVHAGLPPKYRGQIWLKLSGVGDKPDATSFPSLIKMCEDQPECKTSASMVQIEKDVHRTFPGFVWTPGGQEFQPLLRRVLRAYAVRNPSLGYCQSMNFIAGGLLVFLMEEHAFSMLCYIVEQVLPNYFSKSMIGPQVDSKVMEELIAIHLPTLWKHFEKIGMHASLFTTQWFMCLFLKTLPYEAAFCVWDLLFYHGPKALFDVGLSILKLFENDLLQLTDSVDIVHFLNTKLSELYDVTKLWEVQITSDKEKWASLREKHTKSIQNSYDTTQIDDLLSLTRFTKQELQEFYTQYQSLLGLTSHCGKSQNNASDGGLDEDCFYRVLQGIFPEYESRQSEYFTKRMFRILDKDHDFVVDFPELTTGLSVLFRGTLEERFKFCFEIFDANGDHHIDAVELRDLLMSLYNLTKTEANSDFSSEISFFVDMLLKHANKDGALSFVEFKEAALLHPFILKFFNLDSMSSKNKIRIFGGSA